MPLLSTLARRKKIAYFFSNLNKAHRIIEIGSGSGWAGSYFKSHGFNNYLSLDLSPPADIIGNIKDLSKLPLQPGSFDVVIAFEVLEHVDCVDECSQLLKPGGLLFVTTPLPEADWFCNVLECIGLNQKRTSPHSNLINTKSLHGFDTLSYAIVGFINQWGIYRKH